MDPRRVVLTVGSVVFGLILLMSPSASPHTASTWYGSEWVPSHHTGTNITWRFSPGFPPGLKKTRVIEGFTQWNNLGQPMSFTQLSDATSSYVYDCGEHSYHGIFFNPAGDGVGGTIASTLRCTHADSFTIHNFSMKFDQDETWYDDFTNGPNNKHDTGGAASHEAGHATGFSGHWSSGSAECSNTPTHTMCGYVNFVPYSFRNLELHDTHTFTAAY